MSEPSANWDNRRAGKLSYRQQRMNLTDLAFISNESWFEFYPGWRKPSGHSEELICLHVTMRCLAIAKMYRYVAQIQKRSGF